MTSLGTAIHIERDGDTIVVVPLQDLNELVWERMKEGTTEIVESIDGCPLRNVVLDLRLMENCGSSALGFFLALWKRVKTAGGRLVICNVSDHVSEVIRTMHLDTLWPIEHELAQALARARE